MALATQCPHCQTTFRVAHDQLKLRAGLVRCGACKQIFNGIENLLRPEEMEQVLPASPAPRGASSAAAPAAQEPHPSPAPAPAPSSSPASAPSSDSADSATVVSPAVAGPGAPATSTTAAPPATTPAPTPPTPPQDDLASPRAEESPAAGPGMAHGDDPIQESHSAFGTSAPLSSPAPIPHSGGSFSFEMPADHAAEESVGIAAREPAVPSSSRPADDPLLRMTLLDVAHRAPVRPVTDEDGTSFSPAALQGHTQPPKEDSSSSESAPEGHSAVIADDGLEKTIDDLQAKPWRNPDAEPDPAEHDPLDQADIRDYEEPSFVREGRRKQRLGKAVRLLMVACAPLLLLALAAQVAYVFRNDIAARWPQSRPFLAAACQPLECEVGLPAQIEQVTLESSELQAAATGDGSLNLTALLRNHSTVPQAWPHVELTLNDSNEKPIARRIFTPREYLPTGAAVTKGLPPKSEHTVKMHLELAQLKASGFRVYLFHP